MPDKPYQELCAMSVAELNAEPCRCVLCATCRGTGRIDVSHMEYDNNSEQCDECDGNAIVETCDRCQLLEEAEGGDHAG